MGDLMDMPGQPEVLPTLDELVALAKATHATGKGAHPACPHCGGRDATTIGQRIKELRTKQRLTQQRLADACGVTKSAVCQWEADVTDNIGLQAFLKLLTALATDFEYLAFGTGRPAPPAIQDKRAFRR